MTDDAGRRLWAHVEKNAAEVATWPEWKRGELNAAADRECEEAKMSDELKMPKRLATDGAVTVSRPRDGFIAVSATNGSILSQIVMSEHNAWRVFGMLALMLGLKLPAKVARAIKL